MTAPIKDLNKVELIGRIAYDVKVNHTSNNNTVANLKIVTVNHFKGNEYKSYHSVVVWGDDALAIGRDCSVGSQIGVVGRLQSRSYEDREGNKKYVTEVVANKVDFIECTPQENQGPSEKEQTDDLPF